MKNAILFMAGAVALAVGVAVAAEEEDPVWTMELRTPWLTPAREIMNLGGEGAGWKATYTEQLKGEYLRKAGWADVFHWTDGPVDEKNAKWVDVLLPRPSATITWSRSDIRLPNVATPDGDVSTNGVSPVS